ncbi:MAG: hypothetical protein IJI66_00705 [Erysipelotrichaceae bacterium]|nr:hypothetical protein [Erysipelotrichaceae bacterium]
MKKTLAEIQRELRGSVKTMNDKNKLNIEDMKDVNGGSIWVSEDRAKAIGVELRNEDGTPGEFGYLWNSGDYYFNGQKLD